mmetsp:Transcript_3674/g.9228  ORF Transcript_3674/g.9228 Transcript_3674/m.9228 type:complete len:246 (+) Transcript_3674:74-811(+)
MARTGMRRARTGACALLLAAALVVAATGVAVRAEEDDQQEAHQMPELEGGFLIVHKTFDHQQRITLSDNITVSVEIHNAGPSEALDIVFTEFVLNKLGGRTDQLKLIDGPLSKTYKKLDSGEFVAFTQVFRPDTHGLIVIPEARVTYKIEKKMKEPWSVLTARQPVFVLSSAQATTGFLLKIGRIVSLGFCTSLMDWARFCLLGAAVFAFIAGKSSWTKFRDVQTSRKRTRARRALGVEEIMKDK